MLLVRSQAQQLKRTMSSREEEGRWREKELREVESTRRVEFFSIHSRMGRVERENAHRWVSSEDEVVGTKTRGRQDDLEVETLGLEERKKRSKNEKARVSERVSFSLLLRTSKGEGRGKEKELTVFSCFLSKTRSRAVLKS